MLPDKLPKYTVPHLENKAEKILRESVGEPFPIPVDVEFVLETMDDVDFDIYPKLNVNHAVQGAVLVDVVSRRICVFIDEDLADDSQNRNRYRMTVAEELSHVILHRLVIDQIHDVGDFSQLHRHEEWPDVERDAKRFAAAVLMPGSAISERAARKYSELVNAVGFGDPGVIKKYLRNLLADEFEVSPESMGYRLTEWPMKIYEKVDQAIEAQLLYLP